MGGREVVILLCTLYSFRKIMRTSAHPVINEIEALQANANVSK
jgi:hypothetical protein